MAAAGAAALMLTENRAGSVDPQRGHGSGFADTSQFAPNGRNVEQFGHRIGRSPRRRALSERIALSVSRAMSSE